MEEAILPTREEMSPGLTPGARLPQRRSRGFQVTPVCRVQLLPRSGSSVELVPSLVQPEEKKVFGAGGTGISAW